ncbi:GLPGLI family protein [Aequorivita echinoideorum]|uniref:GLPGLI family protein n=1 Tax=Aequorivita echinoideorum TaxID=1549647 RepID=A0ABS5S222_9FLAO|nr:GLPGLI family protein [Aequorivita echinoideorum]MBT0607252.1 GLPGLI family protein [Aequorivita echinoideorum]
MKYFFLFFLSISFCYSQTGKITYSSNLNFNGYEPIEKTSFLYFNNGKSYYQNEIDKINRTGKDENINKDDENKKTTNIKIRLGSDSIGNVYFSNLQSNKLVCREALYDDRNLNYYIYEDIVKIEWELHAEFKEISTYKCQKATAKFRGRNYVAWFTTEIPLSFGPYKFRGLPGLILEIYDQTGEVYFSAERIEIPYTQANQKVQNPKVGTVISYQEFVEKGTSNINKITQAILARSPEGTKLVSTDIKKNGIELEYPWEKE